MRAFTYKTLATLMSIQAVPGVAEANGGHLHSALGDIPLVLIYVVVGFFSALVVFFVVNWARYRRAESRGDLSSEPQKPSLRDEREEQDVT